MNQSRDVHPLTHCFFWSSGCLELMGIQNGGTYSQMLTLRSRSASQALSSLLEIDGFPIHQMASFRSGKGPLESEADSR